MAKARKIRKHRKHRKQRKLVQVKLRLPRRLHRQLVTAAEAEGHSLNYEIVRRAEYRPYAVAEMLERLEQEWRKQIEGLRDEIWEATHAQTPRPAAQDGAALPQRQPQAPGGEPAHDSGGNAA
jgi:hypothetical protein